MACVHDKIVSESIPRNNLKALLVTKRNLVPITLGLGTFKEVAVKILPVIVEGPINIILLIIFIIIIIIIIIISIIIH